MTRREWIAGISSPAFIQTARPKNVVLLIADDMGLNTGAYGDPNARTPSLDRLASEGVRFTNGFCTAASCSPSRSVMLTGLHNHSNGQYGLGHATHNFAMRPGIVPFPRLLKQAGYATGLIGKFHVNPSAAFGWDLLDESGSRDVQSMAERARQFILRAGEAPFYLHMGYSDPHREGQGYANQRAYSGVTPRPVKPSELRVPGFLADTQAVREDLAGYYQSLHRLDDGVGMMLEALRQTGKLESTLVIFVSDNGIPFANAKTTLYDSGVHLPLIVRAPGVRSGTVNRSMVSWTDLAPTILDWAGARGPEYPLHGRSFLPILNDSQASGWDEVYLSHTFHEVTMHYPMRGVRTRRFKYLRNLRNNIDFPIASDMWASPGWQEAMRAGHEFRLGRRKVKDFLRRPSEELYDVEADPLETNNLALYPKHATTLKELRSKVQAFQKNTADPWVILDRQGGKTNAEGL